MIRPISIFSSILVAGIVLCFSCGQSADQGTSDIAATQVNYVDNIKEDGVARVMIEGMSCERMCVSTVKKSMAAIPTVTVEDMRFDADQTIDTLTVSFDPASVTEQEIIKAIESQAGGTTYHVTEVQLSKDSKTSMMRLNRGQKRHAAKAEASRYRFQVPNFLEILRRVSI